MRIPAWLVDPVDHQPLHADGPDLASPTRRFPAAAGSWDLRPPADDNKRLQAEIYDGMLGELSDFHHPHNLMLVHEKKLLDGLPLKEGDRVLEISGHRSGALPYLEERGAIGVGVDISATWVQTHNAIAARDGRPTRWFLADAEALPFADNSFAAILAFDVFEHLSQLPRALEECCRVLQPGGTLVCHMPVRDIEGSLDGLQRWRDAEDYAARQASVGHFHDRMPSRSTMRTWLEQAGFTVQDVLSFNVWLQPLHDHKLLPLLGKLRHRGDAGGGGTPGLPRVGASRFQRAYSATAIPILRALTVPDRIGSRLGIGGSCSFVARKP